MAADQVEQSGLSKFLAQDRQYVFPYHYIPHIETGYGVRFRALHWGLEYLCYTGHARQVVRSLAPSSVLDVGCGDGRFLGTLDWGVERRKGVDLSERAIRFARAFHEEIAFEAVDAGHLEGTFDVVTSVAVLEHVPQEHCRDFLASLEARTRDGGHIVLVVPTHVIPLSSKHYRHYDLSLLEKQVDEGCRRSKVVGVEYVYRKSRLMECYLRLTHNRLWFIEFSFLNHLVWRHVWNRLRIADEKTGQYIVAVLQKGVVGR